LDVFGRSGERFSELFLLGPNQTAEDFPFNVVTNQNYLVHLGIGNHLDAPAYYVCYFKIRNQTEPLPDESQSTPSALSPFHEYRTVIQNEENRTVPVSFSLSGLTISNGCSRLQTVTINDVQYEVNKIAQYDQENNGYYYQVFVELWACYPKSDTLQYQNRYVYFWLNATTPVI